MFKNVAIWLVIGLIVLTVVQQFDKSGKPSASVAYSDFLDDVRNKRVTEADIEGRTVTFKTSGGEGIRSTTIPYHDKDLINQLYESRVKVSGRAEPQDSLLKTILFSFGPILLLIGAWIFMMRQMQGGGKGGAF
ncbi:MAG: cell division protein FtsH, partial [Burkholderiales bacterium]